jgi:hypothetical protein
MSFLIKPGKIIQPVIITLLDCFLGGGFDRDLGEQKKNPRTRIDWTFVRLCSDLRFKLPLALERKEDFL